MAPQARGHERSRRQAPEGDGDGEHAAEEATRGRPVGKRGDPRGAAKRMVTAPDRRAVVRDLVARGLSERHGVRFVRMSPSALRDVPRPDPGPGLRGRITALAHRPRRYGAGMICLTAPRGPARQSQACRSVVCRSTPAGAATRTQEDPARGSSAVGASAAAQPGVVGRLRVRSDVDAHLPTHIGNRRPRLRHPERVGHLLFRIPRLLHRLSFPSWGCRKRPYSALSEVVKFGDNVRPYDLVFRKSRLLLGSPTWLRGRHPLRLQLVRRRPAGHVIVKAAGTGQAPASIGLEGQTSNQRSTWKASAAARPTSRPLCRALISIPSRLRGCGYCRSSYS